MATLARRLERARKTTSIRFLRANLRFKRAFSRRAGCIFITAMPKTASTFLVASLAETTGWLRHFLGDDFRNEQNLYLPKLIDSWNMNIVCHQHMRATPRNLELMREFSIRPVVLVRPLADVAVSLLDHIQTESRITAAFHPGADFLDLSRTKQLDAIVDIAMPWFVQFHAGWREAAAAGAAEALFVDFDEVTGDPAGTVARILEFQGLERPGTDAIEAAIGRVRAGGRERLNQGVSGRGRASLSAAQRRRLAALAGHYPAVDFAALLDGRRHRGALTSK